MRRHDLRMNVIDNNIALPLKVYTVGIEKQLPMTRIGGFSGHQLLVTRAGTGRFRLLGQHKWDIIDSKAVMFLPAGLPHQYESVEGEDWIVSFVSFIGSQSALEAWGFGDTAMLIPIAQPDRLNALIEQIWRYSGMKHDPWLATERLLSCLTELKKQMIPSPTASFGKVGSGRTDQEAAVIHATKFMRDYMHRELRISQLAAQIGYSQKQLTRLFLQALGTTPLQYLKALRLETALTLLAEQPGLSISQIARQVGLEPVYFTRIFHQQHQCSPSEYRAGLKRD